MREGERICEHPALPRYIARLVDKIAECVRTVSELRKRSNIPKRLIKALVLLYQRHYEKLFDQLIMLDALLEQEFRKTYIEVRKTAYAAGVSRIGTGKIARRVLGRLFGTVLNLVKYTFAI